MEKKRALIKGIVWTWICVIAFHLILKMVWPEEANRLLKIFVLSGVFLPLYWVIKYRMNKILFTKEFQIFGIITSSYWILLLALFLLVGEPFLEEYKTWLMLLIFGIPLTFLLMRVKIKELISPS